MLQGHVLYALERRCEVELAWIEVWTRHVRYKNLAVALPLVGAIGTTFDAQAPQANLITGPDEPANSSTEVDKRLGFWGLGKKPSEENLSIPVADRRVDSCPVVNHSGYLISPSCMW